VGGSERQSDPRVSERYPRSIAELRGEANTKADAVARNREEK